MYNDEYELDPTPFDLRENLHIIEPTNGKASALVVFLGGNVYFGECMRELLEEFNDNPIELPHVRWLIPEAPFQIFSPMNMYLRMWYDREGLDVKEPEIVPSMDRICRSVVNLVKPEIRRGIPISRMVIGGYSQGATVALYLGLLRYLPGLAGVCTISPYFSYESQLFKFGRIQDGIRIFMAHGALDEKFRDEPLEALLKWKKMGARELYINITNGTHRLCDHAVTSMMEWILEVLPPLESDKIVRSDDDRDSETGAIKSKRLKLDESSSGDSSSEESSSEEEEENIPSEKETAEIHKGEESSEDDEVKDGDNEVQKTDGNAAEKNIVQETEENASKMDTEPFNGESRGRKIVKKSTTSKKRKVQESSDIQESESPDKMEIEDRI